jgi:hypothetical protein
LRPRLIQVLHGGPGLLLQPTQVLQPGLDVAARILVVDGETGPDLFEQREV